MTRYLYPKAAISSALLRISAVLGLIGYFWFHEVKSIRSATTVFIGIVLTIGSAYLVRKGTVWIRWVLLVLIIPVLILSIIFFSYLFIQGTAIGCFSILQTVIEGTATILLFIPYKMPVAPIAETTTLETVNGGS